MLKKNNCLQKLFLLMMLPFFALAFFAASCSSTAQPAQSGGGFRSEAVQFEADGQFTVQIKIPDGWGIFRDTEKPLQGAEKTYSILLVPEAHEKALLSITIGKTQTGGPLTQQQFDSMANEKVWPPLLGALENDVDYTQFQLTGGYGKYCTLTEERLVGKSLEPHEFLYFTLYFANYDNGFVVFATALADDKSSPAHSLMLESLLSIRPLF
jgi:hypothetical protein